MPTPQAFNARTGGPCQNNAVPFGMEKIVEDMFIHFDTVHERDRRTDKHHMTAQAVLMHSTVWQKKCFLEWQKIAGDPSGIVLKGSGAQDTNAKTNNMSAYSWEPA